MKYTTSDSEEDEDYDPKNDPDYRELTDEEEYETDSAESTNETNCFEHILEEKDREIEELKRIIKELRQILKCKINVFTSSS